MAEISNTNSNTLVSGTSSDDNIINTGGYTTIYAGAGYDYIGNAGDNVIIFGESDGALVENYGSNVTIYGSSGNDSVSNGLYQENYDYGSYVKIDTGAGNDTINNESSYVIINGGKDNDQIFNVFSNYNVTINGDAGSDRISVGGYNLSVNGGADNDTIFVLTGSGITVSGGAGNDSIYGQSAVNGTVYYYVAGDGSDTVRAYKSNDTIKIAASSYTTTNSGYETVINVGEGSILLQYYTGNLNIETFTDGYDSVISGSSSRDYFWYGGSENHWVTNFTSGMAENSDIIVLPNGFSGAYRDDYNVFFYANDGKHIKLQTDTNSSDDAIFYSGDGQNFYVAKIADSSATNITYYDGIDYYGLAQFGTLNLQNGTHDANSHDIRLDGSNGISYLYIANVNAAGSSGNDYLAGNSGNNSIIAGSGETTLWGGNGGDDTLVGGSAKDYFRFTGEGNDVVVDFTSGMANNSDAAILPENFTVSRSNNILTFSAPNGYTMTVNTDSYSGDDAILYSGDGQSFYSAKIADSTATNITYYENIKYYGLAQFGTLNLQNGTHDGNSHDIRLDGSNGVSYLYIANINASGSSGNDTLYGNAGSNEIRAGSGNSTLWGGQYDGTADILIGGDGVDTFLVGKNDGNDVIQSSSYNDVINLYDVSLSEISTSTDENNIYLSLNNGSQITIQNSDNLSSAVWTSDGGRYRYNRSSSSWQSA